MFNKLWYFHCLAFIFIGVRMASIQEEMNNESLFHENIRMAYIPQYEYGLLSIGRPGPMDANYKKKTPKTSSKEKTLTYVATDEDLKDAEYSIEGENNVIVAQQSDEERNADVQMDLLSLPDEMLSIVLNHSRFGKRIKLRKMNKRLDVLDRRLGLANRVPVSKFEFERNKNHLTYGDMLCDLRLTLRPEDDEDLDLKSPITFRIRSNLKETLKHYLPKIFIEEEFSLGVGIVIRDDDVAVLYKNRRYINLVQKLHFEYADIDVGEAWARRMYRDIFPEVNSIEMYHCFNYNHLFNIQLLRNRKWTRLHLNIESTQEIFLENQFLNEIVSNCEEVKIVSNSSRFTIFGIVDLIKTCIAADGTFNRKFVLGYITVFEMPFSEVQESFYTMIFKEGLRGMMINYEEEMTLMDRVQRKCKLTFQDRDDAPYLQFSFTTSAELDRMP